MAQKGLKINRKLHKSSHFANSIEKTEVISSIIFTVGHRRPQGAGTSNTTRNETTWGGADDDPNTAAWRKKELRHITRA
jgi:hypothetical protein